MSKKKKMESSEKEGLAMRWRLKETENEFQVTRDGPFAFHTFRHGEIYERIPAEEKDRFETIGGGEEE